MSGTICTHCEYCSVLYDMFLNCEKGRDTYQVKNCDDYVCAAVDRVDGTHHRKSRCIICGKTIYRKGNDDVPIYCDEHRAYAKTDSDVIQQAPKELLFGLVAGIFLRAREDYVYNAEGQRQDAEMFLRSQWAQDLSGDGFNVESLFALLDREKDNEPE